ncbi:MAG: hypothetical protein UZ11_BCD004000931 [Bacteroidetes bacterium OLB11]|nr:MAG: hypothetical protein UZ11_BCD004000931 [Bacteroidetes bacterium OLB11]
MIVLAGDSKKVELSFQKILKKNIENISSLQVELVNIIINKKKPTECELEKKF